MRSILRIILLFLVSISAFSQGGVCDLRTDIEKGNFDVPSAVCIGQQFNAVDKSGGTDIKYIFGYAGQAASQLPSIPSEPGPNSQWAFSRPADFIVLQYGKKNGKDMYACKVITVRDKSEPKFSYRDCNNSEIEISISDVPSNNFDYYTIDWGDGNTPERVEPTALPYKRVKSLTTPRTIKVSGAFNTASTCAASSATTIPYKDNSVTGFTGYDDPNYPNIQQIVLKEADEAVLTIGGSYDPAGYSVYMTPKGTPYAPAFTNPTPVKTGVLPGDVSIPIPDTTKSYCFYIEKPNACGVETSAEICTMVLTDVNPVNSTSQEIIWEEYPTDMSHVSTDRTYGRFMDKTTQLLKEEDGVLLPEIPVTGSPYTDNVNCRKEYCYRVKTETKGQIYYYGFKGVSISKQMCLDREDFHPPGITDALVSVNDANASEINYTDNSSWTLQRDKYILYHDDGTAFKEIMSNPTVAPFIDINVNNSQKSNCYKIAFVDECGSTSELSPPFCTTFLSEANRNELIWTGQPPFADIVIGKFDVESYDENTGVPSIITSLPAAQLTYSPDLSRFEEEAKFRIKITGIDGSESYSNTYTIPLTVKLLLPDAFSPNNDAINDRLELKGTFRRIADFDFQIYNRWGNPVFSSSDPLRTWDGNFQGGASPVDTYTYKIYAKLIDGTEINKTGKFLLIR
jgi:gliding motility-associated-like protein